jgi:hypothetical protein
VIFPFLKSRFDIEETVPVLQNPRYNFVIRNIRPRGKDFALLVTDGLSSYLQPVTESSKAYERIELYFCLPDYWDLQKNPWPVTWLNRLAEVPRKNKSWFGPGDTIPAGKPPVFVDEKLKTDYFVLSPPVMLESSLATGNDVDPGFKMLAVIPIFRKEFDYKMQNSGTLLLQKLAAKNVTEMIDIFREPVARKKFMGMF